MKPTRMRLILLTLISALGLGMGAFTYIQRAAHDQVYAYNCGILDFKPTSIRQFCANEDAGITNIEWDTWNTAGATGTGQYAINLCDPNCVAGKWEFANVKVRLSKSNTDQNKIVLSRIDIVTINGKNLPQRTSPKLGWDLERKPT